MGGGRAAAAAGSGGEQGEVPHAGALADGGAIGESHPEDLDPAVGARPGVVPVVAAVRAPPRHPAPRGTSLAVLQCFFWIARAGVRRREGGTRKEGGEPGGGSEV